MKVDVRVNVGRILRGFKNFPTEKLPFALALATTKTAQAVADAQRHEMSDVFDKPTPYTLDSVFMKSATKTNINALVGIKNFSGKGTPATKFLMAEIVGGARKLKRFEIALRSVGALPPGYYAVPGSAATLDAYGNIDRGLIVQLLSYFKAFPEMGYKANMTDKRKAALAKGNAKTGKLGVAYFAGYIPGVSTPGIWARYKLGHGSAVKPIIMFVSAAHYEVLFDFTYVAEMIVKRVGESNLRAAIKEVMK